MKEVFFSLVGMSFPGMYQDWYLDYRQFNTLKEFNTVFL